MSKRAREDKKLRRKLNRIWYECGMDKVLKEYIESTTLLDNYSYKIEI